MPSLKQIQKSQLRDPNAPVYQTPLKRFMKVVVMLTVVGAAILYYIRPKIFTLPEEFYTAQTESKFRELFATPGKKVVWFGADCPISQQRQKIVDAGLNFSGLNAFYIHYPYLQNSLFISCYDCLDSFVMEHCSGGFCIILPESRRVIQTTDEKLFKDLEKYKNESNEPAVKKVVIDSSKYNDEWDAINMYQKRMAEERDRLEKTKEREMKMRNRADLLNQIQQKIKRKYDEELKDKEYAKIIEQSVKKQEELEKKQKEIKKQQILKEKEIRDKQLRDIYVAKRIAFLKNKKYEKELVEHNNEEIRLAKEAALIKKEKEHEALLKTLKDNELHKQKLLEQERIERENDIKIMEDAAANDIKKENERKAYYESIKRGQQEHDTKMLESVVKKRNEQLKQEEDILNNFWKNQDLVDKENEIKKKLEMKENQRKLKMYYDKQVEEKKAKKEYERQVDLAQGRIWKQDYLNYLQYENETSRRIKELIRKNMSALNNQANAKKKNVDDGMSENEKAMNKEILEKAKKDNKQGKKRDKGWITHAV